MNKDTEASTEKGVAATHEEAGVVAGETHVPVGAVTGEFPAAQAQPAPKPRAESTRGGAFLVGAGILLSRVVGLLRQRVFAYYLGTSDAMDAFQAAFRIP